MSLTKAQAIANIAQAVPLLEGTDDEAEQLAATFYNPPPALADEVEKLRPIVEKQRKHAEANKGRRKKNRTNALSKKEEGEAGKALERIALLAFASLRGRDTVKSYQSAGPQHDLWVEGNGHLWTAVCRLVRLKEKKRGILVEAKAWGDKIREPTFARLCAVLLHSFPTTGALGVFMTINGAAGFPSPDDQHRKQSVAGPRLRQVIMFHASETPVIVLTWREIEELTKPGSLVQILRRAVADITELGGKLIETTAGDEVDLPEYLQSAYDLLR